MQCSLKFWEIKLIRFLAESYIRRLIPLLHLVAEDEEEEGLKLSADDDVDNWLPDKLLA